MSDVKTEDKTQEGTGQEETTQINTGTGTESTEDQTIDRNDPKWQAITKNASEMKRQLKERDEKLAKFEADAASAAEEKRLKNEEHLEIIAELKAEKAALELKTRQASISDKLRNAGMESPLALKGAVYSAPKDADEAAIEQWISELKASNPAEFQARPDPVSQTSVGPPATSGGVSAEQIKIWEKSPDKDERQKANRALREYREKHGRYPD